MGLAGPGRAELIDGDKPAGNIHTRAAPPARISWTAANKSARRLHCLAGGPVLLESGRALKHTAATGLVRWAGPGRFAPPHLTRPAGAQRSGGRSSAQFCQRRAWRCIRPL